MTTVPRVILAAAFIAFSFAGPAAALPKCERGLTASHKLITAPGGKQACYKLVYAVDENCKRTFLGSVRVPRENCGA